MKNMKGIVYKTFDNMPYFLKKKISDISKNEKVEDIVIKLYMSF